MEAFKPFGDGGVSLSVGTSSANVAFVMKHHGATVRVVNRGSEFIRIKFGDAAVVADVNDMLIPPNWVELFLLPNDATHCAAIGENVGNTLVIEPGDGS